MEGLNLTGSPTSHGDKAHADATPNRLEEERRRMNRARTARRWLGRLFILGLLLQLGGWWGYFAFFTSHPGSYLWGKILTSLILGPLWLLGLLLLGSRSALKKASLDLADMEAAAPRDARGQANADAGLRSDIAVSAEALAGGYSNIRDRTLVIRTAGHAEIRPSGSYKVLLWVFILVGLSSWASIPWLVRSPKCTNPVAAAIGLFLGGAVFGSFGVAGYVRGPGVLSIDLAEGVVRRRGGRMEIPELAAGVAVNRLAAIQLCTYVCPGRNANSTTMYELNAVLDGGGKRFTLMSDDTRHRLVRQANELAEMLKLPIIYNA
jgi:hypothetical protein